VAFFKTHNLDVAEFKRALQQCVDAPEDVFPGWVRKEEWDDVLWLYTKKWSDLPASLAKEYELPEASAKLKEKEEKREKRPAGASANPKKKRKVESAAVAQLGNGQADDDVDDDDCGEPIAAAAGYEGDDYDDEVKEEEADAAAADAAPADAAEAAQLEAAAAAAIVQRPAASMTAADKQNLVLDFAKLAAAMQASNFGDVLTCMERVLPAVTAAAAAEELAAKHIREHSAMFELPSFEEWQALRNYPQEAKDISHVAPLGQFNSDLTSQSSAGSELLSDGCEQFLDDLMLGM
jgi:hypothetical protein